MMQPLVASITPLIGVPTVRLPTTHGAFDVTLNTTGVPATVAVIVPAPRAPGVIVEVNTPVALVVPEVGKNVVPAIEELTVTAALPTGLPNASLNVNVPSDATPFASAGAKV